MKDKSTEKVSMVRSVTEKLSRRDIAYRAASMLHSILGVEYDRNKPAPLKKIIDKLSDNGALTFSNDSDLGVLPNNKKIYGRFNVEPCEILIDSSLDPLTPRYYFSLAHEIGHFFLHRDKIGHGKYIDRKQLPADSAQQLKSRYKDMTGLSDLGWVEWQANEYALELILPSATLRERVREIQLDLGIVRNLGTIRVDWQPCNQVSCGIILSDLTSRYQIPGVLLKRRLRHLGILEGISAKNYTSKNWDVESVHSLFYADERLTA